MSFELLPGLGGAGPKRTGPGSNDHLVPRLRPVESTTPSSSSHKCVEGCPQNCNTNERSVAPSGTRWRSSLPVLISNRTPTRQYCRFGVSVIGNLHTPRPGLQSMLEWLRGCFKPGHELFGHRFGDEASNDVTNNSSPHSSIRLSAARISSGMLAFVLSNFVEHVAIVIVVQERTQMSPYRWAPCCSTTCRPQTMKKIVVVLSNSNRLAGTVLKISPGIGSHGMGGRLSSSNTCRVSSLSGATGDPSSAWRAAEISPTLINDSARSTLFSTMSPVPSANICCTFKHFLVHFQKTNPLSVRKFFSKKSRNLFSGTLPPRARGNTKILGSNAMNLERCVLIVQLQVLAQKRMNQIPCRLQGLTRSCFVDVLKQQFGLGLIFTLLSQNCLPLSRILALVGTNNTQQHSTMHNNTIGNKPPTFNFGQKYIGQFLFVQSRFQPLLCLLLPKMSISIGNLREKQ